MTALLCGASYFLTFEFSFSFPCNTSGQSRQGCKAAMVDNLEMFNSGIDERVSTTHDATCLRAMSSNCVELWHVTQRHGKSLPFRQGRHATNIPSVMEMQEENGIPPIDTPLALMDVRDSVAVQHHHSGIDIVLEHDIPQPWRERFLQASIGSTRLADGPYATDWEKFLDEWEREMQHLHNHRVAHALAAIAIDSA
ncbi:hypothetical protein [Pseudomonas sp. MF7448]|uniref:hypothetical protein n=1 Tax=Pseudomonas sp. MF7448 TaxID=2797537 RepID=UPI002D7F9907|nr:hypothetical protein [Pseudomonas sp. MF7448]